MLPEAKSPDKASTALDGDERGCSKAGSQPCPALGSPEMQISARALGGVEEGGVCLEQLRLCDSTARFVALSHG